MTMINSSYHFMTSVSHSARNFLTLPPVAFTIKYLTTPHFRLLQGLFLCGYGMKEILFDRTSEPDSSLCRRICRACCSCFNRLRIVADSNIQHGLLFVGSGLAGAAVALHQLEKINVGSLLTVAEGLDLGLFLAACLVGLRYNVLKYSDPSSSLQEKKSAVLGIISNLNYLFWGLCPILGASATFALVFCGIALTTGFLKILYDFFS